ncbi:MAG: hypothetical protein AAF960_19735 [Bacteroidota bacterium]
MIKWSLIWKNESITYNHFQIGTISLAQLGPLLGRMTLFLGIDPRESGTARGK